MTVLHITIASAIFSVMFAYRNYWQIKQWNILYLISPFTEKTKDRLKQAKAKWHKWQFALQIYIGVVIAFISFVCDYSPLNSLGHGLHSEVCFGLYLIPY